MKKLRISQWLCCVLLVMSFPLHSFAQEEQIEVPQRGPRKQLATIIFAGLGGAILGLSTLSFYPRPQDHLENIAVGFAIGVITGTAYSTFKAATTPEDFYNTTQRVYEREEYHTRKYAYVPKERKIRLFQVNYSF